MTWLVLTQASVGAPRNAGVNGDLCALLDWALPQASWAIEYTSTNARVYRPSVGLRNRLYVQHDSAVSGDARLATVRGCENASSATSLTDPFPLVSQCANNASNWFVSSTASTLTRDFIIYLSETFVYYFSRYNGSAEVWEMGYFGDAEGQLSSDTYHTVCGVRNSTSTSSSSLISQLTSGQAAAGNFNFWMRDVTGATKSSRGQLYVSGPALGTNFSSPPARGGYQNRIYREKVGVSDGASQSTTASVLCLQKRAWLPNIWNPLHSGRGSVSDVDTFTDTAYDAAASFRLLSSASAAAACCIMEETDTWSPP